MSDINLGYIRQQWQRALATMLRHRDAGARSRAEQRMQKWMEVLSGMVDGALLIGSRTPTRLPAWVTLEVVRGGFATGAAVAETPLGPDEQRLLEEFGLSGLRAYRRRARLALFAFFLSDAGQEFAMRLLTEQRYRVDLPEDAALLTLAWLRAHHHLEAAVGLLEQIAPYAGRLRFTPKPLPEPSASPEGVFRRSAAQVKEKLNARSPNPRIEAQREALGVWLPFTDRLVELWLRTRGVGHDTRLATFFPPDWGKEARALLDEYEALAATHRHCRKYRNPKENLQILLTATRDMLRGDPEHPGDAKARYAVECLTRARGEPGSARLLALRAAQQRVAGAPGHDRIASVVAARLPASDEGLPAIETFLTPVTLEEEGVTGVRATTPIPEKTRKIVRDALAAETLGELARRGIAPSAETLAELAPQVTAREIGRACRDTDLGGLLARTYRAFGRRRSLLLLNLESQIRFDELPWIQAARSERDAGANGLLAAAHQLLACAVDSFPGVILPNVLVREVNVLYDAAGEGRPFVPELAADIFMGQFTPNFDAAVHTAGALLRGSLYERYFGLDYAAFLDHAKAHPPEKRGDSTLAWAVETHRGRDPMRQGAPVVENGTRIERAQLYTTHNLATLTQSGVKTENSCATLSLLALRHSLKILGRIHRKPEAYGVLAAIKNAAYAWRQALFFLAAASPGDCWGDSVAFVSEARELSERLRLKETVTRPLIGGLEHIMGGGVFNDNGQTKNGGRRFLGWTTERHWIRG
jgi:hypothetical protein